MERFCRVYLRVIILLTVPFCLGVRAQDEPSLDGQPPAEAIPTWFSQHIDPGLILHSEVGAGLHKGRVDQKLELTVWPQLDLKSTGRTLLRGIGRLRLDGFDHLAPGKPSQREISRASRTLAIGKQADLELRELFLRTGKGRTNISIGKQQVVWGQADGLKVLDVVNPQDFQEFILADFDKSRIPLWMMNLEIPVSKANLQLLWVPDRTYHKLPEFIGAFAFTSPYIRPTPPPGIPVQLAPIIRPTRFFKDSDGGARLSGFVHGWDLTVNYLYHYDDIPVIRRFVGAGPLITVTQTYARTHLVGGTFSNAFGSLTTRGEIGFSSGRYYQNGSLLDLDGVSQSNEVTYVLGFDWFGISQTFLSFQFFQSILTDHPTGTIRGRTDNSITLLYQRTAVNDKLKAELLWLQNFNDKDGLVRPKISYDVRSGLKVWTGVDVIYGTSKGLFGQYNRNDRFIAGWEWGF